MIKKIFLMVLCLCSLSLHAAIPWQIWTQKVAKSTLDFSTQTGKKIIDEVPILIVVTLAMGVLKPFFDQIFPTREGKINRAILQKYLLDIKITENQLESSKAETRLVAFKAYQEAMKKRISLAKEKDEQEKIEKELTESTEHFVALRKKEMEIITNDQKKLIEKMKAQKSTCSKSLRALPWLGSIVPIRLLLPL